LRTETNVAHQARVASGHENNGIKRGSVKETVETVKRTSVVKRVDTEVMEEKTVVTCAAPVTVMTTVDGSTVTTLVVTVGEAGARCQTSQIHVVSAAEARVVCRAEEVREMNRERGGDGTGNSEREGTYGTDSRCLG